MGGGVTAFKILFRLETKASKLLFRLDSGLSLLKDPCLKSNKFLISEKNKSLSIYHVACLY